VPYRLDFRRVAGDALDRLIDLGAIDVELSPDGTAAALMPDSVSPDQIARALGVRDFSVAAATGRDDDSVWVLNLRPVSIDGVHLVTLIDGPAFGTGLHPTTALSLEALQHSVQIARPDSMLDVGTGSGVLALAALMMGVPRAVGIDLDDTSLRVAADNAQANGLRARLDLKRGGPESLTGMWPLVAANILAAPLIEMAPALVRRVGSGGQLILSGIPVSLEQEVDLAYRRLGMRRLRATSRDGWIVLVLQPSW
jgi:ribosomal protein L11 methylase PrmA